MVLSPTGPALPIIALDAQSLRVMRGVNCSTRNTTPILPRPKWLRSEFQWTTLNVITLLAKPMSDVWYLGCAAVQTVVKVLCPSIANTVKTRVFTVLEHGQVFRAVVGTNPIDMVNVFIHSQSAAYHPFGNNAVLRHPAVLMCIGMIWSPDPDVTIGSHHFVDARYTFHRTIASRCRSTRRYLKRLSASFTGKINGHRNSSFRCRVRDVSASPGLRYSHLHHNFTILEAA